MLSLVGIVLSLAVCFYLYKEMQNTQKKISRCENFQSTLAKHVNTLITPSKSGQEEMAVAAPTHSKKQETETIEEVVVKSTKNE